MNAAEIHLVALHHDLEGYSSILAAGLVHEARRLRRTFRGFNNNEIVGALYGQASRSV